MLINKVIPLFIIFGVIFALKQKHIFHKQDGQVIGKILVNLVIPATIVNAFSSMTFEKQLLLLPVLGAIVVLSMLGIGFLLSTVLNLSGKTRGAFIISFPTLEGGTIGYVLMLAIFGKEGLIPVIAFDIGNASVFYGVIFFVAYSLGKRKEKTNLASGLLQLSKSPIIWSFLIGIFFNVLHIHIDAFSALVGTISQATSLLIMVMLALEFELSTDAIKLPILTIILKTAIGFSIGVVSTIILHIQGIEQIAIIIGASLPASLLTLVYASENNLDSQFIANLLSIALPCAFLFDITLIYLLGFG